jgi:hypothetical protein
MFAFAALPRAQSGGASQPLFLCSSSGHVLAGGTGLSGVRISLAGTTGAGAYVSLSVITDANGKYIFSIPAGGTYTAVPSLSGYTFNPSSFVFNGVTANQISNSVASVETASSQDCSDISGTWTDGNYPYVLSETLGTVTGSDTLILPHGRVTWTVSGPTTAGVTFPYGCTIPTLLRPTLARRTRRTISRYLL